MPKVFVKTDFKNGIVFLYVRDIPIKKLFKHNKALVGSTSHVSKNWYKITKFYHVMNPWIDTCRR